MYTPHRISFLISLLLIAGGALCGQTVDDFSDGDLLNPDWSGDVGDFVVEDGLLKLNAAGGGQSTLTLSLDVATATDTVIYELFAIQDFAPSATNRFSFTLRRPGGEGAVEVRYGGVSGDGDALEVTYENGEDTQVITGREGEFGDDPVLARVRLVYVRRGAGAGLRVDLSLGRTGPLNAVGNIDIDDVFDPFTQLDLEFRYTATRADKFTVDDVLAQPDGQRVEDVTPPELASVEVLDARTLVLSFSERIAEIDLRDLVIGINDPGRTLRITEQGDGVVVLDVSPPLPQGQVFELSVQGIPDLSGNVIVPTTRVFSFSPTQGAARDSLLITEIMADPNPSVGLPEAEFVEVYNRTNTTLDLFGLAIGSGGALADVEGFIPPNTYVVLAAPEDAPAFRDLGAVVLETDLPSLSNAADNITLTLFGDTIQSLDYTDGWYNDPDRDDGGYTLEYTGLDAAFSNCSGIWRASLAAAGGTPGAANSTLGQPSDTTAPAVLSASFVDGEVVVQLSEPFATSSSSFILERGGAPLPLFLRSNSGGRYVFTTANIDPNVLYTLRVPALADCAGNTAAPAISVLAVPVAAQAGDVAINEILFNPGTGGADFIELLNCSDKILNVAGWVLSNAAATGSTAARTVTGSRLFLPGQYLTFTDDPEDVTERYADVRPASLVKQALPSLPDDAGNITVTAAGLPLDAFDYTSDYHSALLDDENGVSLERLRTKAPTQDGNNWFSAASSAGFATPTRPNSQNRATNATELPETFALVNTTFSPDGDGFEDVLEIAYAGAPAGALVRVRIYDAQGRPVRDLRRVELLAGSGAITWDGADDNGRRARLGLHLIYVELFQPGEAPAPAQKLVAVLAE